MNPRFCRPQEDLPAIDVVSWFGLVGRRGRRVERHATPVEMTIASQGVARVRYTEVGRPTSCRDSRTERGARLTPFVGLEWPTTKRSGRAPLVTMMKAADLRYRHDGAVLRLRDRTRDRRIFVQRQMCTRPLVVRTVASHQPVQTRFVEHNHVIETLATSGSNESLDESIGVSCRLHRQRAVSHKPFGLPIPSIRSVAGRFS
jgi:hypothetical protein